MIGQTVAQYKIVEKLGEGGMGVVYKAEDTRLERDVALKFLRPELIKTEKDKKRFFREARALAALDHPNICAVYELDELDGKAFIAMAFVEGKDLHEIVEQEAPLPMNRILGIMRQVCMGVQAAHARNVVHRDIKSTNIIISSQDHVRILDFGLARFSDSTLLTAEGTTVGTILYMSPEQATGKVVDHRTDIWALGVLFYELITGTFPFKAEVDQATFYLILNVEPKPLTDYRSNVPAGAQEIIDKTLAKEAVDRYQSAGELVEALDRLAGKAPTDASASKPGPPAAKIDPSLVAVFDFVNDAGRTADEWLSGGVAETLTADLKRVRALRTVSRQQVAMASAGVVAAEINEERIINLCKSFGAKWAVCGSYERSGDSIRITADFYETPRGKQVDTMTTRGAMGDVFKLQSQIVSRLTEIVEVELTSSEAEEIEREQTSNEKAFEYYARARQLENRMNAKDFDKVRQLLEKAIELDPNYGPAYGALAALYAFRHIAKSDSTDLDKAIPLAQKAIDIDPVVAEPYLMLAYCHGRKENWEDALRASRKAVELEDDNPMAHYMAGCASVGSVGVMERWSYGSRDDLQEGLAHLKRSIELNPGHQHTFMWLGWIYMLNGQYDSARPYLERAVKIETAQRRKGLTAVGGESLHGNLLLRLGDLDGARQAYHNSLVTLEQSDNFYRDSFMAQTHCGLGDVDCALENFDEALKHYGYAVEVCTAKPTNAGIGFFYVRACAGMGKALASILVTSQANDKVDHAMKVLKDKEDFNFFFCWDACDAEAYYELASAFAELQRKDDAIACLTKAAVDLGWRDLPQLEADESFADLMEDPRLSDIIEHVKQTPRLD
jgi:tetratricopeptide (TPR) repeat protein/tRNA A-37 threonylcarbamoyl transferase component Bud32